MNSGCCTCNSAGGGGQTAGMGCGSCGRGRFVRQLPRGYRIWTPESADIFHDEYHFVVADICPGKDNPLWCPARAGKTNPFGAYNHIDFAKIPKGFDNYYFEFTPEPCPAIIQERMKQSKCSSWTQSMDNVTLPSADNAIVHVEALSQDDPPAGDAVVGLPVEELRPTAGNVEVQVEVETPHAADQDEALAETAPDAVFGTKADPRWVNASQGAIQSFATSGYEAPPQPSGGYQYMATTTQYGTNPLTSCGVDSKALVAGTDYLPVASAQAMNSGCCTCNSAGGGGQTAGMGCGSCGRGRWVRQLPRGFQIWTPESAEIFQEEVKFVVMDICPHDENQNAMWCPAQQGQTNTFGVYNHLDFALVPKKFDNYYFEFSPEACDDVITQRMAQSKCRTGWVQMEAMNETSMHGDAAEVGAGGVRRLRGSEPVLRQ